MGLQINSKPKHQPWTSAHRLGWPGLGPLSGSWLHIPLGPFVAHHCIFPPFLLPNFSMYSSQDWIVITKWGECQFIRWLIRELKTPEDTSKTTNTILKWLCTFKMNLNEVSTNSITSCICQWHLHILQKSSQDMRKISKYTYLKWRKERPAPTPTQKNNNNNKSPFPTT